MAKVLMPLLSTEARGRMGGLVYNAWHGINYVKAHQAPNQPNTQKQLDQRARMQTISQYWATLSDLEREGWATYAEQHPLSDWTGTPRRITAFNWFARCSQQLLRLGEAIVETAPSAAAPDPPTGFGLSLAVADLQATWGATAGTNLTIEFWHVGPHSAGRLAKIEQAVILTTLPGETVSPADILTGAPVGRHTVWARIIDEDTGLTSTWVSDTQDVS